MRYNFAARHYLPEAADDELLQMLGNVGNLNFMTAILFVCDLTYLLLAGQMSTRENLS